MVPAAGVEPATFRSGGERSNPLSYAGILVEDKKIAQAVEYSVSFAVADGQDSMLCMARARVGHPLPRRVGVLNR